MKPDRNKENGMVFPSAPLPATTGTGSLGDDFFMSLAMEEARAAEREGEVPIGCVIACDGQVVAGAHNRPVALHDATAHAEMLALRAAGHAMGNYRLSGATLYVTIEPCVMCVGAMLHARIKRLVYGASDPKAGAVDSLFQLANDARLNHRMEVASGVLEKKCSALVKNFFAGRRDKQVDGDLEETPSTSS